MVGEIGPFADIGCVSGVSLVFCFFVSIGDLSTSSFKLVFATTTSLAFVSPVNGT